MFSKRRFRRNKPRSQNFLENGEQQKETPFIPPVQTKLNIGKPGDVYEVEADKTADEVVNKTSSPDGIQKMGAEEEEVQAKPLAQGLTPFVQKQEAQEEEPVQTMKEEEEPVQAKEEEEESVQAQEEEEVIQAQEEEEPVQAKCNDCSEENKVQKKEGKVEESVQTKSNSNNTNNIGLSSQLNAVKGGGTTMANGIKTEMENAFGNDFSKVNIHTDDKAIGMSKRLNAQAFTHGKDIFFNNGKYNPGSKDGKHLLAHELTHTIQQKGKEPLIQKLVRHSGTTYAKDIDLLDPTTAPKGNTAAVGFTETFINGKEFGALNTSGKLKNELFPLPEYKSSFTDCNNIVPSINVEMAHKVRLITSAPWSVKLSKSKLIQVLGGLLSRDAVCAKAAHKLYDVIVVGQPDDATFEMTVKTKENDHVETDKALLQSIVMSYEDEVKNLPSSFYALRSCETNLNEMLKRNQYYAKFLRQFATYHKSLDRDNGAHSIFPKKIINADCSVVTIEVAFGKAKAHLPLTKKWKPQ